MLDAVRQQPGYVWVVLVLRVGDPSAVPDDLLRFRCYPDKLCHSTTVQSLAKISAPRK